MVYVRLTLNKLQCVFSVKERVQQCRSFMCFNRFWTIMELNGTEEEDDSHISSASLHHW